MELLHPSNVYEESWFLLSLIKILGLYPIKFCKVSCMKYLYVIILLTIYYTLLLIVNEYALSVLKMIDTINTITKIRMIRYCTNIILLPSMMISSMHYSINIRRVHEKINNIDKNIKFFNTEIDHARCMKDDIVRIMNVIFFVILFNLMDYYGFLLNPDSDMYVLMWILDRIPDFVNTIIICSFAILINKIKFRFAKVNSILRTITKEKSHFSISDMASVNTGCRLKLLELLQLNLCKTVSLVNEGYRFQLKIVSIVYILYMCLHTSVIYMYIDNETYAVDVILSVLWGTLDIIKLVYIIHLYHILTIQVIFLYRSYHI
ncbi:uncharacterized protein LOC128888939 isoform X1 [Hylaeus anthracinus]|uniref:uncharacterized protein LOC128888939 isoform X1 n=1 Tax=Hylaeus anthracinus TaxID=313031 RepID=UPI0023B8A746|nr:uncharacterized protein LOC128888939 isoform X1 [Hylaeus anthracinus]